MIIQPKFVDTVPEKEKMEDGVLYISIKYSTAIHKCICGCANEVVTPFSPTDWTLVFDGETVSLSPSIGNWSFPCKSHYWITKNKIRHARKWSESEIEKGRRQDKKEKWKFFRSK